MMGHAFSEGFALLRRRWVLSLSLAFALAVPMALAGLSASVALWSRPLIDKLPGDLAVPVLLHPRMDESQRRQWIEKQRKDHPSWKLHEVSGEELARRLVVWFPYLEDFFEAETESRLPPLVEIRSEDPEEIRCLEKSPAIIALGPTHSVHRVLGEMARKLGLLMGLISGILLFVAVLMAATWTHLEIYRNADEISIMRLVGATETAIRAPVVIALIVPGILAGLLAYGGALYLLGKLGGVIAGIGLGRPEMTITMTAMLLLIGPVLPGCAALIILARHARNDE